MLLGFAQRINGSATLILIIKLKTMTAITREEEAKQFIKVSRIIQRWFQKLTSRADRDYIIKKLQENVDVYEGAAGK